MVTEIIHQIGVPAHIKGYHYLRDGIVLAVKDHNMINSCLLYTSMLEPGRSIVGSSGITLYTVGSIKEIPNIRTYVAVDGGMTDNPRYALYQSEYEAVVANKADQPKTCLLYTSRCV